VIEHLKDIGAPPLAKLVGRLSQETFLDEYWEQQPYHCQRASANYYDDVLTLSELESAISRGDVRYPALQLAKNGSYLPPETYTRNVSQGAVIFSGVTNLDAVRTEYQSGATIVLPGFHHSAPRLRRLCSDLEHFFDHPVHANTYLTPGNAVGFTPHYDTHEVFVLQIAGQKRWKVYKPSIPLPHRSQIFDPSNYSLPARPDFEFDLVAGDLLYLPRGHIHTAATQSQNSAHVTIGITVYTWLELLVELVSTGTEFAELRTSLPAGFASRNSVREGMCPDLLASLDLLRTSTKSSEAIANLALRVRKARAAQPTEFKSDETVIDFQTALAIVEPNEWAISTDAGNTLVKFRNTNLVLQRAVGPALEAMLQAKKFCLADLPATIPHPALLSLARYLQREALLVSVR
jgi:ribosomal protein L16 Arg81 hydroxylase